MKVITPADAVVVNLIPVTKGTQIRVLTTFHQRMDLAIANKKKHRLEGSVEVGVAKLRKLMARTEISRRARDGDEAAQAYAESRHWSTFSEIDTEVVTIAAQ